MSMKKIGVVGAGMMGSEIALCFARSGMTVILADIKQEFAEGGKRKQEAILSKQVAKGRMSEEQKLGIGKNIHHIIGRGDQIVYIFRLAVFRFTGAAADLEEGVSPHVDFMIGPQSGQSILCLLRSHHTIRTYTAGEADRKLKDLVGHHKLQLILLRADRFHRKSAAN